MNLTRKELNELLQRNPGLKAAEPFGKSKQAKYKNVKVYVHENGAALTERNETMHGAVKMTFDSIKEFKRWQELKQLEAAGKITRLCRQETLVIQEAFTYAMNSEHIKAISYKADFCYINENGVKVVEDVKPFDLAERKYRLTKDFTLKWKLLKHRYPECVFLIY